MNLVTTTAPGVYLVHTPAQRPVEGVAVYHYKRNCAWVCEGCGAVSGTTLPDCPHIALARSHAVRQRERRDAIIGEPRVI